MATIKDIASETGLGLATISKYINGGRVLDKNRIAIDAAIDKHGYVVNELARGLKTSKSRTVGVVIPDLGNLFITTILSVVGNRLRDHGYGMIVCDCGNDALSECDAVRFLMSKRVDGIINMPFQSSGRHLAPALKAGVPVVLLDRMIFSLSECVNAVLIDNIAASDAGTSLLLAAGHQNVGVILGPREIFTSQQRLSGYHQALLRRMLHPDDSRIVFSDYTVQGGYESMKRLLSDKDITAVFATNYETTLGGIIAMNEMGIKIPDQVSFIGFDNMLLSNVISPKLTMITQPLDEIGEKAAEILLLRFAEEKKRNKPTVVTLLAGISDGESVKER